MTADIKSGQRIAYNFITNHTLTLNDLTDYTNEIPNNNMITQYTEIILYRNGNNGSLAVNLTNIHQPRYVEKFINDFNGNNDNLLRLQLFAWKNNGGTIRKSLVV